MDSALTPVLELMGEQMKHLVKTTYGEGLGTEWKAECWTVVFIMVRVIWRELCKIRVEAETVYGSYNPTEMVGQYLWGALQALE